MRAHLFAVLVVVVAGCGFERATPYAGTRIPDVGPWTDLGPLTICRGSPRVIAPSLGTAGLCAPATVSRGGAVCTSDADCRSRERCECGFCKVSVCDSADECGPSDGPFSCTFADRRCDRTCDTDAECAAGEECVPGRHVCRGRCQTVDDCQADETCDRGSGLCVTTACTADADCGGNRCDVQRVGAVVAHPSPIALPGGYVLFYDYTGDDGVAAIHDGFSSDGLVYYDQGTIFSPGTAPSVARAPDGSYALVFAEGASLYAARSPDTFQWSTPTPALPNARQPSLMFAADGTPLLWVVDPDGNLTRFSGTRDLVFSTPLVSLTPASASTPLWPDIDALQAPFVEPYVDADGSSRLRLWFAAHGTGTGPSSQFGTPTPTPPDYSIGVAVSADGGATFIPDAYDPVFDRTTDFINHPGELDPAVLSLADHWLLYYRRANADGTMAETLAVATSPVVPR